MWNLRKIKEREQAAQTDKTVSPEHVNQHISKERIMAETGRYRADCRASDRRTNRVRRTRQSSGNTSGIGAGANTGYRGVVREPDEFCREQWWRPRGSAQVTEKKSASEKRHDAETTSQNGYVCEKDSRVTGQLILDAVRAHRRSFSRDDNAHTWKIGFLPYPYRRGAYKVKRRPARRIVKIATRSIRHGRYECHVSRIYLPNTRDGAYRFQLSAKNTPITNITVCRCHLIDRVRKTELFYNRYKFTRYIYIYYGKERSSTTI